MKVGAVVRDVSLLPKLPEKATVAEEAGHQARAEFLLRRARAALLANSSWKGTGADEVKEASKAPLVALLAGEVAAAAAKIAALEVAIGDPAKTDLVAIDDATVDPKRRFRNRYMALFGRTPQQLRDTAIISSGWAALAEDPALTDTDLHTLVSRRLMAVERMLWYVGSAGRRSWTVTAANEWKDGWNRIFEYPRLPVARPFVGLCNPPPGSNLCDPAGKMKSWWKEFGGQFRHDFELNASASPLWKRSQLLTYAFFFDRGGSNDPSDAVLKLFEASDDFRKRNLLMCDHVIQCLHLEALVRVKSKRDGDTSWFGALVAPPEADGWLRIDAGARSSGRWLMAREPRFFEWKDIEVSDLQVGDHVIVFNHPAYEKTMENVDVWRLENALVVATSPRLLLQGHGTNPLPFTSSRPDPVKGEKKKPGESMRLTMIGTFNRKLRRLRKVARDENAKPSPRTVIDLPTAAAKLVQRTDPGPYSDYDPSGFTDAVRPLVRWWIRWEHAHELGEHDVRADSAWAQWVWDHQRVEVFTSYSGYSTGYFSYFPLWLPGVDSRRDSTGKIKEVEPVEVHQEMIPGWDWYFKKGESGETVARRVKAGRPKVT